MGEKINEKNIDVESLLERIEAIEKKLADIEKITMNKELHLGRYYDMYRVIDECDHSGMFSIELIEEAKEAYEKLGPYIIVLDYRTSDEIHDKVWYLRDVMYKDYYDQFEPALMSYIKVLKKAYKLMSNKK